MKNLNEIILANGFLVLIWISYELIFKHQRFFQANRIFLLAGSLLSVALPFLPWQIEIGNLAAPLIQVQPLDESPMILQNQPVEQAGVITASRSGIHWISAGYWATVAFLTLVSLGQLFRLLWWARSTKAIRKDGIRIVPLNKSWSAFSFFRNVYYPAPLDLSAPATQTILDHEKVHIRQWHSIDNLIFVLIRIFFFYNPVVYLLTQRIRLVHEFIADSATAGSDKAAYSHTLISHQFLVPGIILMHSFNNQTFLKRRLTMLTKNKQKKLARLSYALVLPMIALMVLISGWSATAQDQAKKSKEEIAKAAVEKELTKAGYSKADIEEIKMRIDQVNVKKEALKTPEAGIDKTPMKSGKTIDGQEIFVMVEEMPTFQGGKIEDFRNWVQKNVSYPAEAKKDKIQGTVYLSFVVDTDGKVRQIEIIRSANPLLDNEVIRAMKGAPDWKPGKQGGKTVNVAFSIPVKFVLDNSGKEAASGEQEEEKQVFLIVEEMPVFQGGDVSDFRQWCQDHVKYPAKAMENGISGTVMVEFVVNREGKVINAKIKSGADPVLDEAALQVVRSSPDWAPGKQRQKPVNVSFSIPIVFHKQ